MKLYAVMLLALRTSLRTHFFSQLLLSGSWQPVKIHTSGVLGQMASTAQV